LRRSHRTGLWRNGIIARALDAHEHEDGDQHRVAHLTDDASEIVVFAAPKVQRKDVGPEATNDEDDEEDDRHDLGGGRNRVKCRRLFHPAQNEEVDAPENRRGAEDRPEAPNVALSDVCETRAGPVAERGSEAEIAPEMLDDGMSDSSPT